MKRKPNKKTNWLSPRDILIAETHGGKNNIAHEAQTGEGREAILVCLSTPRSN